MPVKWDKEKIALSVAGSLVTIVLGYLVWRHEQSVSNVDAQANAAAQENAQATQDEELQQELQSLPQYAQGGGTSESTTNETASEPDVASSPTDSNIAAILAAFFPTATTTNSASTTGTSSTSSTSSTGTPTGTVNTTGGPSQAGGGIGVTPVAVGPEPILTINPVNQSNALSSDGIGVANTAPIITKPTATNQAASGS